MGNLDEDEMVSLLDYSRYYDKLEMPYSEKIETEIFRRLTT